MNARLKQSILNLRDRLVNLRTMATSCLFPYHYEAARYKGCFITNDATESDDASLAKHIDRRIFVFWTGDNELTPNRKKGFESLQHVAGVEVVLVTPRNLPSFILEEDPLPEGYRYLSLNHRSDYLRSYFMHHYGGGYADIKLYKHSWVKAFNTLEASRAYACGYPEIGYWATPRQSDVLMYHDLTTHWRLLIGNGAFICRPHTKLTEEWHNEARKRLLNNTEALIAHPARDVFGDNSDYPLAWSSMQGEIFHPLCLKYHHRLIQTSALKPSLRNYR